MRGLVRTVRGDLPAGELGVTDAHDHLLLESPVIPGQRPGHMTRTPRMFLPSCMSW